MSEDEEPTPRPESRGAIRVGVSSFVRSQALLALRILGPLFDGIYPFSLVPKAYRGDALDKAIRDALSRSLGLEEQSPADAKAKAEEARDHIARASQILHEMQTSLTEQANRLDGLLQEAEERKRLAEEYGRMASTAASQLEPFRRELANSVREQLEAQGRKGRVTRSMLRLLMWLITLGLGAWLGAYVSLHYAELSQLAQRIISWIGLAPH